MDAPLWCQGCFLDQTPGGFNQDKKQHVGINPALKTENLEQIQASMEVG